MRRASFKLTQEQMRIGAAAARASADGFAGLVPGGKDVTRRLAWKWAQPGMYLCAVSQTQGLRRGMSAAVFGVVEIVDVSRGPLAPLAAEECAREGFPALEPEAFVSKFLAASGGGDPYRLAVTRVQFRHVDVRRCTQALMQLSTAQAVALDVVAARIDARLAARERDRLRARPRSWKPSAVCP